MENIVLQNKPLIEAIFEIRWELEKKPSNIMIDPHYKLLVGQIFDRIKNDYAFFKSLPQSTMPDEFWPYTVQHQFRKSDNGWPLIQVGPGIMSLNDTKEYVWADFEKRIMGLLDVLFEIYPSSNGGLTPNGLLLRYIDAIEFDFEKDNIINFLRDKLKTTIDIHEKLFNDTGVSKLPSEFDLRFSFQTNEPPGAIRIRFVRGKKNKNNALIWETQVSSFDEKVPKNKEDIINWVSKSHKLTHDWFFKLIDGELYERFK